MAFRLHLDQVAPPSQVVMPLLANRLLRLTVPHLSPRPNFQGLPHGVLLV